jgi:ABC-2 type transport system ATP-binding protein
VDDQGCLIETEEVTKSFGKVDAVKELSFSVNRGEIFGLIGPSGCGKTTTIRLLLGVFFPTAGRVSVFGVPPHKFPRSVQQRIGYMPQHFVMYPNLTVNQTLSFMASVYGMGPAQRGKRMAEVLELVELTYARNKRASVISGGMKRRLELACAMLHEPSLLVVDEPTAGIDPILRAKLWDAFRGLREEGRTLFVTTQYVSEAEYCDRVAVMSRGKLAAIGSPQELRRLATGGEVIDVVSGGFTPDSLDAVRSLPRVLQVESSSLFELRVYVESAASCMAKVLNTLQRHDIEIKSADDYDPTFDEVFVRLLEDKE